MGNCFSKKSSHPKITLSNYHAMFSTPKLIFEDTDIYKEKEHLGHILLREIFNGNFSSNIQDILINPNTKVLDVGCGSGFWLMEMASDYQKPRFVGIDLLPVFPTSTFPSNIEFFQHNFLEGLPYEDNTFDFIHMQLLLCDFTELQWETFVYKELARLLKPGGWLEICDHAYEFINCGPITKKFDLAVQSSLKSKNVNTHLIQRYQSLIKSVPSFSTSTVYHEKRNFSLSPYTGDKVGELRNLYLKDSCKHSLKGPIGQTMNVKKKDVDSTIEKIAREFESYNTYFDIHRFYVQKK